MSTTPEFTPFPKMSRRHRATGKELIPPLWYALGSIAATPLVALCMVMAGILMILGWPFIPILCYFQRKEEISKANAKVCRPKGETNA